MKAKLLPLMWAGLALTSAVANAQTASPRVIAGFDHIAPRQVGKVLAAFCEKNGCDAKFLGKKYGYVWNLIVGNTRPVMVGSACRQAGFNYDYCVDAWGDLGEAFMNPARTRQLKAMLEAKSAKVTLMDCSFEWGSGGSGHYVCANGKPLP